MKSDILVGLDIGTTKNCCIIAEYDGRKLDILGKGLSPSQGIKRGMILDIDEAAKGLLAAIVEAERTAGFHIISANIGIAAEHIAFTKKAIGIPVLGHREITQDDTQKVVEALQVVGVPANRKMIQILPAGFTVDDQAGIKNPIDMKGKKLGLNATIITGLSNQLENLEKCINKIGLEKEQVSLIFQPVATSQLLLTQKEKEAGVLLLDMGGEITEYALYKEGWLQDAGVLNSGGSKITSDIAQIYKVPFLEAERLKKDRSSLKPPPANEAALEVETDSNREALPALQEVIEARVLDILEAIKAKINLYYEQGINPGSIVLCGGTSGLTGLDDLTRKASGLPVRLGRVQLFTGANEILNLPAYYGALGLIKFALSHRRKELQDIGKAKPMLINVLWEKLKNWYENLI